MSDDPNLPVLTEILPSELDASALRGQAPSNKDLRLLLGPLIRQATEVATTRALAEMKRTLRDELEVELQRRLAELIESLTDSDPPVAPAKEADKPAADPRPEGS